MGRLKALRPSLQSLPPLIGYMPGDEKAQDKARNQLSPWRAWYKTQRWQDLRMQAFARDGFVCQRTGTLCAGTYPAPNSPVANHKLPHKGNPDLFWSLDNIETVTKQVHDSLIQAEERKQQ